MSLRHVIGQFALSVERAHRLAGQPDLMRITGLKGRLKCLKAWYFLNDWAANPASPKSWHALEIVDNILEIYPIRRHTLHLLTTYPHLAQIADCSGRRSRTYLYHGGKHVTSMSQLIARRVHQQFAILFFAAAGGTGNQRSMCGQLPSSTRTVREECRHATYV